MVNRSDFPSVQAALTSAGFVHHELLGIEMFLDGPEGKPRSAIHVLFAGEKVRPDYSEPAPNISETEENGNPRFRVLTLEALVRMKLTSYRDKDRTHLRDFLEVGLVDASWLPRLSPEHAQRLQTLIDNPEG
jgi:hypothetical protein